MGDVKSAAVSNDLLQRLEMFLEELDSMNLIQTAARLASAVDTLRMEIDVRAARETGQLVPAADLD